MAAPSTVLAAGVFEATKSGAQAGTAILWMQNATAGSLTFAGTNWAIVADPAKQKLTGTAAGSSLELRVVTRSKLQGEVDGVELTLSRSVLQPIPPAERSQFDPGPTGAMKAYLDSVPDYAAAVGDQKTFWYAFGPVLYRGRLDGSARVLGIASDPGPTECLPFVRRTLVGDSGQKTQGFLAKLGLARSYVLVNAFAVALHPSQAAKGRTILETNATLKSWRNGFYDHLLAGGHLQAIVAFGENAQDAYDIWAAANPAVASVPVVKVAHPAAVDRTASGHDAALQGWAEAVTQLRAKVTPDPDGNVTCPNFGAYYTENDYVRIPRWDLPAPAPLYVGDDSWGRAANPRHNNCCDRPSPDDGVSMILKPPSGQGIALRYYYESGSFSKATDLQGKVVPTDANGIPLT